MADDRMKHDNLDKNLGSGKKGYGQQTPGRGNQEDQQFAPKDKSKSGQGMTGRREDNDVDSQIGGSHGMHGGNKGQQE